MPYSKIKKREKSVMKKFNMLLVALTAGLYCGIFFLPHSANAASQIKIDQTHFPDKTFRKYVKEFDTNKNGYLSQKERKAVKKLKLYHWSCSLDSGLQSAPKINLKGMEYFPKIKNLEITNYKVKNLNLAKLKKLVSVDLMEVGKKDGKETDTVLDFSQNTNLKNISIESGNTKQIYFPKNNKIQKLELSSMKQLKNLSFIHLSQLKDLSFTHSKIEKINLNGCTNVRKINLSYNDINKITIDACTNLEELDLYKNNLKSLDLTQNKKLKILRVDNNNLFELDLSQNKELTDLNISRNNLLGLDLSKNAALTSINCSTNFIRELDISALKQIETLNCNGLQLKELNLKENKVLRGIACSANQLETLDVSQNTKLTALLLGTNPIEELTVSMLPDLYYLDCSYNRLENLDISQNKKLEYLNCIGNRILSLNTFGPSEKLSIIDKQQLLTTGDGAPDTGITIDKEHFPDYALRYVVLAEFDTNHDGILSEKESQTKKTLNLKKYNGSERRLIDCTGIKYLKGITSIVKNDYTTLVNNSYSKES